MTPEQLEVAREQLEAKRIAKLRALNPVEIAKVLVHDQDARQISEAEFVDMISNHDRRDGETAAQTFARHYEANTQDGALLRAALQVTKAAYAMVDEEEARDIDAGEKARAQLQEIGAAKWPTATKDVQFARALEDPANSALAAQAVRRPKPTSVFPMPR